MVESLFVRDGEMLFEHMINTPDTLSGGVQSDREFADHHKPTTGRCRLILDADISRAIQEQRHANFRRLSSILNEPSSIIFTELEGCQSSVNSFLIGATITADLYCTQLEKVGPGSSITSP
uniref:Uncharacterized protein n=1 Tax=Caenorhabditis japonica TaxID=281687 RepID=A0A8R1I952_CAEJA